MRYAGLDVLNLANNHAGDYGMLALLDTVRATSRRAGALPIGAGATLAAAREPRIVTRLGLRIAFVGFSDIGPASSSSPARRAPARRAAASRAIARERAAARAPGRRRDRHVSLGRGAHTHGERAPARVRPGRLAAGASAVIGAHPHVLQPSAGRPGAG